MLKFRLDDHRGYVNTRADNATGLHFIQPDHSLAYLRVTILEQVKKKCTKFPYCNQGDINNLKISKNESVKESIYRVAKKMGVSPNVVMTILEHEYEILNKRIK